MTTESALVNSVLDGLFSKAMVYTDLSTGTVFRLYYSIKNSVRRACLQVVKTREDDYSGLSRIYTRLIYGPGQPLRSEGLAVRDMVLDAIQNFDLVDDIQLATD